MSKPSDELLRRAREFAANTPKLPLTRINENTFGIETSPYIAEFAEQIVRECAGIAWHGSHEAEQAILRKFGLKE